VADYPEAAPRRRRGRGWVILLVFLVILGGVAIAADRIAANVAEKEVTDRLVAKANERGVTAASTEVTIDGFPFLTQVAKGKYDKVTITMHEARAKSGRQTINLNELVVVATGVNADTGQLLKGEGDISADHLTGTARMDWADFTALTDYSRYGMKNVKFAQEGEAIRVTGQVRILQLDVNFTAAGKVSVAGGKLNLQVSDLKLAETRNQFNVDVKALLPTVVQSLSAQLSQAMTPPALPFGLVISDVHPERDGLSVSATGQGVPLNQ